MGSAVQHVAERVGEQYQWVVGSFAHELVVVAVVAGATVAGHPSDVGQVAPGNAIVAPAERSLWWPRRHRQRPLGIVTLPEVSACLTEVSLFIFPNNLGLESNKEHRMPSLVAKFLEIQKNINLCF